MPQHQGFGHVTLTVTDLERSAEYYNRVFDAQTVDAAEDQHGRYAVCMGQGFMIGLRKHPTTPENDSFHFARVGIDHMGVHVESKSELEKWRAFLDEQGLENSGIVQSPYGLHINTKDPDGIAIEFFVGAQQA